MQGSDSDYFARKGGKYEETCLVDAFRAHRVKVPYERSGPFYALKDGRRLLAPFSRSIARCSLAELQVQGQFVVGYKKHFVAVRQTNDDGLEVNFTNKSHLWHRCSLSCTFPTAFHRPEKSAVYYLNPEHIDVVFRVSCANDLGADRTGIKTAVGDYKGGTVSAAGGSSGGAASSLLVQHIGQYIAFRRTMHVLQVTRRNLQEFITEPSLWFQVPNPLDGSIDGRTWQYWIDSVEYEARKVTSSVDVSIMLPARRTASNGEPLAQSISDVDRAAKRLDAWTEIMLRMIDYAEVIDKNLILSPIDPSISKRTWEQHLFDIRRSVRILNEAVATYVETDGLNFPYSAADDYVGGASPEPTSIVDRTGSLSLYKFSLTLIQ